MDGLLRALAEVPFDQPLATFIFIFAGGAAAQLLSNWARLPSIVFLLLVGLVLGPDLLNWVQPDHLQTMRPAIIRILVAIIMFEGGMTLRLNEVRAHGKMVWRLVTFGALMSFLTAFLLAGATAPLGWQGALLFASLMVVTGPTVILPLLKRLSLQERMHSILKWEGILIDPLGGILAVLCLELVVSQQLNLGRTLLGFGGRILLGCMVGVLGGMAVAWLFKKRFLLGQAVEELGGILGLSAALVLYGFSETILPESGLVCVTAFGILVGHTRFPYKHEILAFKEQVTTVAVSVAFVLLASSVRLAEVREVLPDGVFLVLLLMFLARPLTVLVSAWGTDLVWREKAFLSLTAPRGIVAVSFAFLITDVFAQKGFGSPGTLVPLVFLVVTGTVLFSGLLGSGLAHILRVREERPRDFLIVGANALGRALARELTGRVPLVKLLDQDPVEGAEAARAGFHVYRADPTNQKAVKDLDLKGIQKMLAVLPSREGNILACQIGSRLMGHERVFRMDARPVEKRDREAGSESWGTPLSYVPLPLSDLLEAFQEKKADLHWETLDQPLAKPLEIQPTAMTWPFLAVLNGEVLFLGEKGFPKGAEVLYFDRIPGT